MRDQVCIVLNEREAQKARAAEKLAAALGEQGAQVTRLEISKNLEKVLVHKEPSVVIIDFLLGDYSTGLDVMTHFEAMAKNKRPSVVFLTDEPSIQVAVEAMKRGAADYVQLDAVDAVDQVVQLTIELLDERRVSERDRSFDFREPNLEELIYQTSSGIELINRARSLANLPTPILVIAGGRGMGRSALARAIHAARPEVSYFSEIDLDLCDQQLSDLIYPAQNPAISALIDNDRSLFIDHAEADAKGLIHLIEQSYQFFWPKRSAVARNCYLTIGTSDFEVARAWTKLLGAELLKIPDLKERTSDFQPLVQKVIREISEQSKLNVPMLDGETIVQLSSKEWPGGIRQLLAVVSDAVVLGALDKKNKAPLRELLNQCYARWMATQETLSSLFDPDEFTAAIALDSAGGDKRLAAARLGCSVQALQRILGDAVAG